MFSVFIEASASSISVVLGVYVPPNSRLRDVYGAQLYISCMLIVRPSPGLALPAPIATVLLIRVRYRPDLYAHPILPQTDTLLRIAQ